MVSMLCGSSKDRRIGSLTFFFSHLSSGWFSLCRLPLPFCWLPGSYVHLGEASEACGQTPRYVCCAQSRKTSVSTGLLSSMQPRLHARHARKCSGKWLCCVGTSASMLPKSLCWFAPGKTARPTSPQHLTCSTTSARCTSIFSNTNAPSRTVHACLPCGWVRVTEELYTFSSVFFSP